MLNVIGALKKQYMNGIDMSIAVVESEQIGAIEHLEDLCALEEGLTAWEVEFVEKKSHQIYRPFSRREVDKIQEIWLART